MTTSPGQLILPSPPPGQHVEEGGGRNEGGGLEAQQAVRGDVWLGKVFSIKRHLCFWIKNLEGAFFTVKESINAEEAVNQPLICPSENIEKLRLDL